MKRFHAVVVLCWTALGCTAAPPSSGAEPGEELSGGDTTVFDTTRNAFSFSARNLVGERRDPFFIGNAVFNRSWVTAPASVEGFDGLGPVYNAVSCSACHFKDGRGRPPAPGEPIISLLFRLSVPGSGETGEPLPEPAYGGQLNPYGVLGVPGEAMPVIEYEELPGTYDDGEPFSLRRPRYRFEQLAHGPLAPETMVSPRVAPAMIGLGLLESVPEEVILQRADPDDADGDGISGRPNYVWTVRTQRRSLGRFGWKANQPTVEQQVAGAYLGDLGITSPLFPTEGCTASQPECANAPSGGSPELDEDKLREVAFYSQLLAVPGRRDWEEPTVLRGKSLFGAAGCASCHTPQLTTGNRPEFPELSDQVIRPYTDLLLHDMGEELADNRPDFDANGKEWRTAPLWGVGLVQTVNRHTEFLHDGRARNLAEAVLWHGGEAAASRDAFKAMPKADREALLAFLESL